MRILKRKLLRSISKSFAFLLMLGIAGSILFFRSDDNSDTTNPGIGIGVADDMSGFVVDYIIKENKIKSDYEIKPFLIRDC
mgnify:FL=1